MITPAEWQKSSFSGQNSNCVEVHIGEESVSIRDSKYLRSPANRPADQPVLTVSVLDWALFVDVVAGRSDDPAVIDIETAADGRVALRADQVSLVYTPAEWDAFMAGVKAGEFASPMAAALT